MTLPTDSNKELTKFYEKAHLHLEDLELLGDASSTQESQDDSPEGELFGEVIKDEFIKILNSYDKQQESQELKEKPVHCDSVVGGSYSKLLYSKPGFHHIGSTSYLAKNLEINSIHRNSFLGGHSSYNTSPQEDIAGLRENQERVSLQYITSSALHWINNDRLDLAREQILLAYNRDPKNGDVLATRGRYYMAKKEYTDAIKFFKSALNHRPSDELSIKMYLSDALYQDGYLRYSRKDYKVAKDLLNDALKYNPDNQGAEIHKNLCEDALQRKTLFAQRPPAYRNSRQY